MFPNGVGLIIKIRGKRMRCAGSTPATDEPLPAGLTTSASSTSAKLAGDGKMFYCASAAVNKAALSRRYDYYSTQGFPSTPVGQNDDNVRAPYNYYPQPTQTEMVSGSYGSFNLPVIASAGVNITFTTPDGTAQHGQGIHSAAQAERQWIPRSPCVPTN